MKKTINNMNLIIEKMNSKVFIENKNKIEKGNELKTLSNTYQSLLQILLKDGYTIELWEQLYNLENNKSALTNINSGISDLIHLNTKFNDFKISNNLATASVKISQLLKELDIIIKELKTSVHLEKLPKYANFYKLNISEEYINSITPVFKDGDNNYILLKVQYGEFEITNYQDIKVLVYDDSKLVRTRNVTNYVDNEVNYFKLDISDFNITKGSYNIEIKIRVVKEELSFPKFEILYI